VRDYDRPHRNGIEDYERAAHNRGYELGGSTGFITSVDDRHVAPVPSKSSDTRRLLQGYAITFNRCIFHDGNYLIVRPGAFDEHLANKKKVVKLILEHDDFKEIASTDDALELYSDEVGLAFRCRLPNTRFGNEAHALASERIYTGMSARFTYKKEDFKSIAGEDVIVIGNSTISEISLLKKGAIRQSYALLVDDNRQPLSQEAKSGQLRSDAAFMGVYREMQNVRDRLDYLT
jgi:HK97 family phage prohead protease